MRRAVYGLCFAASVCCLLCVEATSPSLYARADDSDAALEKFLQATVDRLTKRIGESPDSVGLYSERGTAYFQLGRFQESLADFDRMIELDSRLKSSHWRRGITLYYLGEFADAAHQFEIYHTFDNVDRENGIWRFLCQAEAHGMETARKGLLKYQKDDRAPFPDLYAMFAGNLTDEQVLQRINKQEISEQEREKQLFYAHLYVGLYALTADDTVKACRHLLLARDNNWGRNAGGGPGYMWHVARVHCKLLQQQGACHTDRAPEK